MNFLIPQLIRLVGPVVLLVALVSILIGLIIFALIYFIKTVNE